MRYVLPLFFTLVGCHALHRPAVADKPVVVVNGHRLTAKQMANELAYKLRGHDALSAKDPKLVASVKSEIVRNFIVQNFANEWARKHDVLVKAEDLDARIKDIQRGYPDELSFQQALSQQGITFAEWRERLKKTMLQKKVIEAVTASAQPPTDAEMRSYYTNHKSDFIAPESALIRQILVKTESDAKMIETELKHHKNMAKLAAKYSISPESKKGGVVGWVEKGTADVFKPAFYMKPGQLSPIFKSAFGYHIFEVISRKSAHTKAYKEVKDQIQRILMEKQQQSLYLSWLEEQTRKAQVFKDQALIDAMKVETRTE